MKNHEIQKYIDFLFSIAIPKCGNLHDAEDLVQETILAVLTYETKGKEVQNYEALLRTILNRKYYDLLRKKYQLPTVTISPEHDISDDFDFVSEAIRKEEAENVRREVAFLSEIYRTIIAKHYFYGKSIKEISAEGNMPEGTVKSRLNYGRLQLMKGMTNMENYTENSYMPQTLIVANSGCCGLNEEPMSLVNYDNPLAQNLLILAYNKPLSITELSKAIGVSSAYVEPVVNKLVRGELMQQMGDGRVYTDFIIYEAEDYVKHIKEQENFVSTYAEAYLTPIKKAIEELKKTDFYSQSLERHMLINIAENGLWISLENHRPPQILPQRPNGGRWIAFGTIYPPNYAIPKEKQGREEYSLSGHRITRIEKYLNAENLKLYNYETSLYPYPKLSGYEFQTFLELETNILKLFYLIKHDIAPETVDCDTRILKAMPLLEKRGFITMKDCKPKLLIPCLTHEQEKVFWAICKKAERAFAAAIEQPLSEYIKTHKKKIPAHLKSVPEQKLTMPYEPNAMMFVYEAIHQGIHPRDLGYACPETFAVMD